MEPVGVGLFGQDRGPVVIRKGLRDGLRVVQEVEHEHVSLLRVRPVEARQRLDRPDPRERLVDVHRVQQRLVVAGLELVRADEEPVRVLPERIGDLRRGKAVQAGLAHPFSAEVVLARERDKGLVGAPALPQVVADGVEVLDRALDPVRDHHRPRLAADPVLRQLTCSWKWSTMISALSRIACS